ncbi:MAG: acyl-CoA dehydrogenase family protein [Candidatus Nanopelagicales bacterium]|jgi:alkylation response protein AidB-like acyl-CoA dehydrogenase|nr:acyl-CoA dehydrogenase family protein [Candidatus Nanopelagicales bacterium]MDP4824944.1 acyl-CoA dehydrogenase family protein [Candidatus Nanopelagicales bacterium]MDP4887689.1 acyl-CoA dehydrogenase family protein [Candidatus Nanopelagicales bacterium]
MTCIERRLPSDEARALLDLTRDMCAQSLAPVVDAAEEKSEFPRDIMNLLGQTGLLSLPYPEQFGGGAQPYEVYLQVLEELSSVWLSVGISVSVHSLACFPVAEFGTDEQRQHWLPMMLAGDTIGAYCLSEPHSGSDASALSTQAAIDVDGFIINGQKAWITHGDLADFYNVMVRTGESGANGISCLLVAAGTPGLSFAPRELKMGAWASPTAGVIFDDVRVGPDHLIGTEDGGFRIAMAALDAGRLGIAACAVGLAQGALDAATTYAQQRRQFGRPIAQFQGLSFMLADMDTAISAARALYLDAARRKDDGVEFGVAAAKAKLFATDTAMKVANDALQVLGGYGYTRDFPLERYFREAKMLQIVEGTNQVQRMVIGRALTDIS